MENFDLSTIRIADYLFDYQNSGSISGNVITITENTKSVTFNLSVEGRTEKSDMITLPVLPGEPIATTMELHRKTGAGDIIVPSVGAEVFVAYEARVYDQFHKRVNARINWTVAENPVGVSISEGGVLAVSANALPGQVRIDANDMDTSVSQYVIETLRKESSALSSVKVLTEKVVANTATQLLAEYKDQYGQTIAYNGNVEWRLVEASCADTTLTSSGELTMKLGAGENKEDAYAIVVAAAGGFLPTGRRSRSQTRQRPIPGPS